MTARLIETGTEAEWLAARRRGVTASEIAVVMGLSPYDSPFALYHRKRGDLPDVEDSDAMERGRILEPYIADKFQASRQDLYVVGDGRTLYAHPDRAWQLATPDRLVHDRHPVSYDPLAVLETKTDAGGSDEWGDDGSDQIPVHYRCQVLWQCDVIGVKRWHVACLAMRSWKLRVYTGEIDADAETDLKIMRDTAQCFLDDIRDGRAPDVDWRPQTAAALKHLNPKVEQVDVTIGRQLSRSYRAAIRRADEAGQRKNEMTNRMLAAIGNGRRAIDPDGQVTATRSAYPHRRISTTALRDMFPDAARACTVTRDVIKLLPAKPKKDQASA